MADPTPYMDDPFKSIGGGKYINGGWQPASMSSAPDPIAAPGGSPAGAASPAGGAPTPITNAQGVTGTESTVGQTNPAGSPTTVAQSFQQALVNRLNPQTASPDSPGIAPAIQANHLSEQRNFENNRNILAEQNASQGTNNSGGADAGVLGLAQDRAQREGQFAGNAVMQQSQQDQQGQNSAMGLAGSLLSGQQGLGQQMDLANLDAALRRQGMNQQNSLGQGDLALRGRLGEGQLNLGLLSALLSNDQFGKQLGQNAQEFGANLDQSGLLGLLGGLR